VSSIKSLKHRRAHSKMSKKRREELSADYVNKVRWRQVRQAAAASAMHAGMVRKGILDRITECFEETRRFPEGRQTIRRRGYGGGKENVVFPSRFIWVGSGYMCVVD
jgi:hypothetical protein